MVIYTGAVFPLRSYLQKLLEKLKFDFGESLENPPWLEFAGCSRGNTVLVV